jgi:hypothetical protein
MSPDYLDLGGVDQASTGPAHPFVVTNAGTQPAVMGSAAIRGAQSSAFAVVDDGCVGRTLAVGSSCTVDIAATPLTLETSYARLVVPFGDDQTRSAVIWAYGVWPAEGAYSPLSQTRRILDTRAGLGAPKGQVAAGRTVHLSVAGLGVPTHSVSAVALNLTVTGPTAAGYVTAFPTGVARPMASTINFPRGWTGANFVTVPVGAGGKVDLYNCCGKVSLIADIVGWYAKDDGARTVSSFIPRAFQIAQPQRLLDTRTWGYGKLPSHYYAEIPVHYSGFFPSPMVVTVTALGATSTGYVTTYTYAENPTKTSTLNLHPGVITTNLAMVKLLGGKSTFRVYNGSSKPVHLLIDAVGFYDHDDLPDALRYRPVTPTRIVDTRIAFGSTPFAAASTHEIHAPDSVADDSTWAVLANVTAVKPTVRTFLTAWPSYIDLARPAVSFMNPGPGATVANSTITGVGFGNNFKVYNSSGTTNLVIDVAGTFQQFPPAAPAGLRGATSRTQAIRAAAPALASTPKVQPPRPLG